MLVGEVINAGAHIRTLAAYRLGAHVQPLVYDLAGSACAEVIAKGSLVADGDLQARFGQHPVVAQLALDSLVSTALCSPEGLRTGVLAVGFPGRVSNPERFLRPLHIFAARAGAELERLRAEREARASEQRVRELIDALPDKAFLFDREGRYLIAHVPPHLAPLVPVDSLVGRRMDEVLPPSVAADFMRELSLVFETGVARQFERELESQAERRTYEFRLVPFGPERAHQVVPRHHRPAPARTATVAVAEAGESGATGRRRSPRLQQSAHRHSELRGARAGRSQGRGARAHGAVEHQQGG